MRQIIYVLIFFLANNLNSQNSELFERKIFVFENDTLNYRILKPLNYEENKQYPVHLFLHGAGERGDDNVSQLIHGGKLFLEKENREKYKSWVIFPQCSKDDRWPSIISDNWNKTFENKTTTPNKSL